MGWDYEISIGTSINYITRKISIRWWEKFTYEPILQKIQQEFALGDKNQFLLKKKKKKKYHLFIKPTN